MYQRNAENVYLISYNTAKNYRRNYPQWYDYITTYVHRTYYRPTQLHIRAHNYNNWLSRVFRDDVVSVGVRYINKRTHLTIADNRVIPKNCQVAMALHAIHRDPEFYPNPKRWDPENFALEKVESRNKNSFVAFGLGPRGCIGKSCEF